MEETPLTVHADSLTDSTTMKKSDEIVHLQKTNGDQGVSGNGHVNGADIKNIELGNHASKFNEHHDYESSASALVDGNMADEDLERANMVDDDLETNTSYENEVMFVK